METDWDYAAIHNIAQALTILASALDELTPEELEKISPALDRLEECVKEMRCRLGCGRNMGSLKCR